MSRSPRVLAVLVEHPRRRSGLLRGRLELEGELIVGLIGDLIVVGGGRDDQPSVLVRAQGVHREHRGREIGDVEPTHQLLRQGRVLEVDHDSAAFLTDVHGRARIVELHDDLARAVGAATEIDIADRAIAARRSGGTRRRGRALTLLRGERRGGACAGRLPDQNVHAVAFDARLVGNHRAQVHDDARPAVRFGSENGGQRADVGFLAARVERERGVRQIERDSRRIIDREAHRLGSGAAQAQP